MRAGARPRHPRETPVQAVFGWSVLLDTVLERLRLRNARHSDQVRAAEVRHRRAVGLIRIGEDIG